MDRRVKACCAFCLLERIPFICFSLVSGAGYNLVCWLLQGLKHRVHAHLWRSRIRESEQENVGNTESDLQRGTPAEERIRIQAINNAVGEWQEHIVFCSRLHFASLHQTESTCSVFSVPSSCYCKLGGLKFETNKWFCVGAITMEIIDGPLASRC